MNMQNGSHAPRKKKKGSGGFIKNTFIISKNDTPQAKTGKIIAIIALVLVIASLVLGGMIIWKYVKKDIINDDFMSMLPSSDVAAGTDVSNTNGEVSSVPDEFDGNGILKELSEWYKMNPETIGHIYIPDTKLDYPVAKGEDNLYYLNHTLKKEKNAFGTPFVDYRATFANGYQSANVTIYAHNSQDGGFFESVKYYKDMKFYKEHPIVNFDTIYGKGKYKIIGRFTEFFPKEYDESVPSFYYNGYVDMNPNTTDANQNAEAEKYFNKFLTELDKRNYYESGVDVKFGDSLLTLSTCNDEILASATTPYRDVLVARKVRPGEDATVDTSKIKENTDMIMPEGWIKKFGKENPYK